MAPGRRNLAQREQHERPPMHLRMGEQHLAATPVSARVADLPATEIENIDVQLPRSPVAAEPAAGLALDAFEGPEQSAGGHRRFNQHNRVQVG